MKRLALSLLMLVALASTAGATTYNVGGSTPLSFAFQNATGGDIINVANGTYSKDSIRTTNSGSAGNFIRIIGNPADTSAVNLTGGDVVIAKDYISLNGFHITAGGITINASHDSVTSCMADSGGLVIEGEVTAGDTTTNNRSFDVVYNTTFKAGVIAAGGSAYASRIRCASDGVLNRVRIFATIVNANADSRGRYFYGARRFTVTDCKFVLEVWGNANGEQYTTGIRDRSQYNVFTRDTVWVGLKSSGSRPLLITQSGSFGSSALNNTWYACDYRSKVQPDANDGFVYAQDGLLGGRFYNCLFADSSGTPFNVDHGSGGIFQNCTFYSAASPKVWLAAVSNPTTTRIGGCAFISPATATCPGTWAANSLLTPFSQASIGADSNYYACADTAKLQGSVAGNGCGNTLKDWVTATHDDAHSVEAVYASGSFTSTTWATLDLRPASGSPLISASAPGGYYGAYSGSGGGGGGPVTWTVTSDGTLSTAMAGIAAGDVVLISDGTYTATLFSPAAPGDGTGLVRIVGNTTRPNNVVMSGTTTIGQPYLSITGIMFKGGTTISSASHDSITLCIFAASSGAAVEIQGTPASLYFANSTVFSEGKLGLYVSAGSPTSSTFSGNVFASRAYSGSCSSALTTRGACLGVATSTSIGSSGNYFAPAVLNKAAASTLTNACWTLSDWTSNTGNDANSSVSVFSADMFKDARYSHLDLRPRRNSVLVDRTNVLAPRGYWGALAPASN